MNYLNNKIGYTLLEILISISIGSIVLTSFFNFTQSLRKLQDINLRNSESTLTRNIAQGVLEQALTDGAKLRQIKGIHIENDANNLPQNIREIKSQNSTVIAFLEIAPEYRLIVVSDHGFINGYRSLVLCLEESNLNRSTSVITDSAAWVAIGVEGYSEFRGIIKRRTGISACNNQKTFTAQINFYTSHFHDSIYSENLSEDEIKSRLSAQKILLVLPVSESYFLFVDKEEKLRRISRTSQENQPIAYGVHAINVEKEEITPQTTFYKYFVTSNDMQKSAVKSFSTQKSSWLNLIF